MIKDEVLCSFSDFALSKFLQVWAFACLFVQSVKSMEILTAYKISRAYTL